MKVGSLASNPNKLRLMEILLKRSADRDEIVKKMRLPLNTIENILSDLTADGFVELSNNVYKITEEGKKALKSIKEDVGGKRK